MAEGFPVPAAVPPDFKYLEVLRKGRPEHTLYDSFSLRHPKMPQAKRAKIFAPFAALKGYDEAVAAKELVYTAQRELPAEQLQTLNRQLAALHRLTRNSRASRENRVIISVTFFVPCADTHSEAYGELGSYQTETGVCRRVSAEEQTLRLGERAIPLRLIWSIESPDPRLPR